MRYKVHALIPLALLLVVGCKTVHTSRADGVPVAMWLSVTRVDQQGRPIRPAAQEVVAKVLREKGLHPWIDEAGVSVPELEETRAREILLTDERLADSDVIVLLAIPAGTGRKTPNGFEVPAVAPHEPMHILPAQRSK